MSGVPYHAWTHRPKAQGGTDPIAQTPLSFFRAIYDNATGITSIGVANKNLDWTYWQNQDTSVFEPVRPDFGVPVNGTDLTRYIRLKQKGLYSFRVAVVPTSDANLTGWKTSLNEDPEDNPYALAEDDYQSPSASYGLSGWITFKWDRIYPLIDPFDSDFYNELREWPADLGGSGTIDVFFTIAAIYTSGSGTVKRAQLEIVRHPLTFPTDTSWPPPS